MIFAALPLVGGSQRFVPRAPPPPHHWDGTARPTALTPANPAWPVGSLVVIGVELPFAYNRIHQGLLVPVLAAFVVSAVTMDLR